MPRYENIHTYIISTTYIWYEWNIHYNQISFSAGKKYLEWNTHQRRSRPGLQFTTNWKTCFQLMPVLNLTIFYHYWNKIVDILQTQFPNYKMFHSFYKVWILVYYNQVPLTLGLFSLSLSCSPDSSEKRSMLKNFPQKNVSKYTIRKSTFYFVFHFIVSTSHMNAQVYVNRHWPGHSVGRKYLKYVGFHIPKIWQSLKHFAGTFL